MLQMLNHSGKQSNQGLEVQKLISQLEVHGAPISKEDINKKFLRSLPPSWNQIALIMRNKPDIDKINNDDLYNNLRVYEDEMKRSSNSTSNSQNLAFLSSENTNYTNEVSTVSGDFRVSTVGGISQVPSTPYGYVDCQSKEVHSKDRHFARDCRSGRNQGRRSYEENGRINAPTNESSSQALVAQDGLGGYDWSNDFDVEPVNYALMAISSSSSSSSSNSEICLLRPSASTARPICTARLSVSTTRPVCTAKPNVSTARPVYATRLILPKNGPMVQNITTAGTRAVVNTGKGKLNTDLKKSRWVWRPKRNYLDHVSKDSGSFMLKKLKLC
ncbi:hypothetical protein Tco_0452010 [Tanacetum coccineum]